MFHPLQVQELAEDVYESKKKNWILRIKKENMNYFMSNVIKWPMTVCAFLDTLIGHSFSPNRTRVFQNVFQGDNLSSLNVDTVDSIDLSLLIESNDSFDVLVLLRTLVVRIVWVKIAAELLDTCLDVKRDRWTWVPRQPYNRFIHNRFLFTKESCCVEWVSGWGSKWEKCESWRMREGVNTGR